MKKSAWRGFITLSIIILSITAFTTYYDYKHSTEYLQYTAWLSLLLPLYPPLFFYFSKKKKDNLKK